MTKKTLTTGLAWRSALVTSRARIVAARTELALRRLTLGAGRPHGLASELIVSLTSYPERFPLLHLTLECLLHQSVRADRVILWLAPQDIPLLPRAVTRLCDRGLAIMPAEDTRSYKKIVPALLTFPDAAIVTADDDLYFQRDWLGDLVEAWREWPDALPCHRAHDMRLAGGPVPLPYGKWDFNIAERAASATIFPTSGAGVLYPPGSLDPDVTRSELFRDLCPMADDIWLYVMGRRRGNVFRKIGPAGRLITWELEQESALWHFNQKDGGNDLQMRNVMAHYAANSVPGNPICVAVG